MKPKICLLMIDKKKMITSEDRTEVKIQLNHLLHIGGFIFCSVEDFLNWDL